MKRLQLLYLSFGFVLGIVVGVLVAASYTRTGNGAAETAQLIETGHDHSQHGSSSSATDHEADVSGSDTNAASSDAAEGRHHGAGSDHHNGEVDSSHTPSADSGAEQGESHAHPNEDHNHAH